MNQIVNHKLIRIESLLILIVTYTNSDILVSIFLVFKTVFFSCNNTGKRPFIKNSKLTHTVWLQANICFYLYQNTENHQWKPPAVIKNLILKCSLEKREDSFICTAPFRQLNMLYWVRVRYSGKNMYHLIKQLYSCRREM